MIQNDRLTLARLALAATLSSTFPACTRAADVAGAEPVASRAAAEAPPAALPPLELSACWWDTAPGGIDSSAGDHRVVREILARELTNRVDVGIRFTDFTICASDPAALSHDLPLFVRVQGLGPPPAAPLGAIVVDGDGTMSSLEGAALAAVVRHLAGAVGAAIDDAKIVAPAALLGGLPAPRALSADSVALLRAAYVAPRLASANVAPGAVTAFAAPGFQGDSTTLTPGSHLASHELLPASLGSIVVPAGVRVTACTSEVVDSRWRDLGRGPCRRVTGAVGAAAYLGSPLAAAVKRIDVEASADDALPPPPLPRLGSGSVLQAWSASGRCEDSPPTASGRWRGARLFPSLAAGELSRECLYRWEGQDATVAPAPDDLAAWADGPWVDATAGIDAIPCAGGACAPPTAPTNDGSTDDGGPGGRPGCEVCKAEVADSDVYVVLDTARFAGASAVTLSYTPPATTGTASAGTASTRSMAAIGAGAPRTVVVPFSGHAAFVVKGAFPGVASGVVTVGARDIVQVNVLPHPADLGGWTVLSNGGEGWAATPARGDQPGVLSTSYGWDVRQRVVDLAAIGYSPEYMDSYPRPTIAVSERFAKTYCGGRFYFRVELLDANRAVVGAPWDGSGDAPSTRCAWDDEHVDREQSFTDYPPGVRYVRWTDGGVDTLYWAGHYGPSLSAASLHVKASEPGPPASAKSTR